MKKQKLFSTLTATGYALMILAGACLFAIMGVVFVSNKDNEGFGAALTAALAIIFMLGGGVYAFIGIIPMSLKLINRKKAKGVLAIAAIPFDVIYLLINSALILLYLTSEDAHVLVLAVFLLLTLISISILILNVLDAKYCRKIKIERGEELINAN